MPTLGEMLLADGICTQTEIDLGVRNQVIMGGLLGTNLLEMGLIDEPTLAVYLARQYDLPSVAGDGVVPDRAALALLEAEAVKRLNVIPYRIESNQLTVLCIDPQDQPALDEVASITHMQIKPVIVPEIRFWKLLKDCYDSDHQQRYVAIQTRDFVGASFSAEPKKADLIAEEDLGSRDDFVSLYRGRDGFPRLAKNPEHVLSPVAVADSGEAVLTFDQASRQLAEITDRQAIARLVLRFARSLFKRCILLTVNRGVALGWDASGEGVDSQMIKGLLVPLHETNVFQTVCESGKHYVGALSKTPSIIEFLRVCGQLVPLSVVLIPVLVDSVVVNLLYADNGHRSHCSGDIGELLKLAELVGQSYQAMFEKKRQAFYATQS